MTNHCLFVMFTFLTLTVDDAFQDHPDEETHFKSFGKYDHDATEENMTNIIATDDGTLNFTMKPDVTCDDARIKCALRQGCGTALQSYMLDCADIMHGRTTQCDEFCKASLIALTSTEEGESLVNKLVSAEAKVTGIVDIILKVI
ncbi:hypothetical protein Anas_10089 [Armadillidium nasatum]|uniref:Chondroitin proteoglycan 4 domain-containing protein n=1 Tax=Armadillidium nasatum TaxID=96803 RepID=A0A5N5TKM6_9CRUS|nr:hypothetical protein Anas_10089 [Armadillidium nasatum]